MIDNDAASLSANIRLSMRALQKNNHEAYTCKGRKSVSVGSVCVLGKPWLELLADRFLLLLLLLLLLLRQRTFSVRPETFLQLDCTLVTHGDYVITFAAEVRF